MEKVNNGVLYKVGEIRVSPLTSTKARVIGFSSEGVPVVEVIEVTKESANRVGQLLTLSNTAWTVQKPKTKIRIYSRKSNGLLEVFNENQVGYHGWFGTEALVLETEVEIP